MSAPSGCTVVSVADLIDSRSVIAVQCNLNTKSRQYIWVSSDLHFPNTHEPLATPLPPQNMKVSFSTWTYTVISVPTQAYSLYPFQSPSTLTLSSEKRNSMGTSHDVGITTRSDYSSGRENYEISPARSINYVSTFQGVLHKSVMTRT